MDKYNPTNLAYDFDLFLPKEKRKHIVEIEKNRYVKQHTYTHSDISSNIKTNLKNYIISGIIIVGFSFAIIYFSSINFQLTEQINKTKEQISILSSEKTRLEMEIEKLINYENLEVAAREHGLQKQTPDQIVYIGELYDHGEILP